MILTDYYRFVKLPDQKSIHRIDCKESTWSYDRLELLRDSAGFLFLYLTDNTYTKAGIKRKADLALSKRDHISSIYTPDVNVDFWYGDFNNSGDAILFVVHNWNYINGAVQVGSEIEMFIARGQRHNCIQLFNLLCDGELDDDMETLRENAGYKDDGK